MHNTVPNTFAEIAAIIENEILTKEGGKNRLTHQPCVKTTTSLSIDLEVFRKGTKCQIFLHLWTLISIWSIIWNIIKTLFNLENNYHFFGLINLSTFFLRSSPGIVYSFRSKKWGRKNVKQILFGHDGKFKECLTYGCQSSYSAKAKNEQSWWSYNKKKKTEKCKQRKEHVLLTN